MLENRKAMKEKNDIAGKAWQSLPVFKKEDMTKIDKC